MSGSGREFRAIVGQIAALWPLTILIRYISLNLWLVIVRICFNCHVSVGVEQLHEPYSGPLAKFVPNFNSEHGSMAPYDGLMGWEVAPAEGGLVPPVFANTSAPDADFRRQIEAE